MGWARRQFSAIDTFAWHAASTQSHEIVLDWAINLELETTRLGIMGSMTRLHLARRVSSCESCLRRTEGRQGPHHGGSYILVWDVGVEVYSVDFSGMSKMPHGLPSLAAKGRGRYPWILDLLSRLSRLYASTISFLLSLGYWTNTGNILEVIGCSTLGT